MEEEHGRGLFDGSSFRESFASDALAAFAPSLLDDEPLGVSSAAPHADDVFSDVSAALELGEHDQSLFPMLSDTSLDFIDVDDSQQIVNAGATTADENPFETQDLSPILAPISMPTALESSDLHLSTPSTPVVLRRHSGGVDRIVLRNSPATRQALMQLADAHASRSNTAGTPTRRSPRKKAAVASLIASPLRRRQRSAATPLPLKWSDNEQNSFFSLFKAKWPPSMNGQPQKAFGSLLLQRFDQISTKVKTKSVIEVRQFYNAVLQNVAALLQNVEHDIDLANPDEIRIAVWCWSKLLATEADALQQFQSTAAMDESVKARVAHSLHQSIVRSRRQMLKAKSTELVAGSSHRAALTSISTWMNRSSVNAFSATPSTPAINQRGDHGSKDETAIIHHPVVRRKNSSTPIRAPSPSPSPSPSMERGSSVASPAQVLLRQFGTPKQGKKTKRSLDEAGADAATTPMVKKRKMPNTGAEPDFMSPPQAALSGRAAAATNREIAFQTPQELSRKKMYIKMRMVPMDSQTKAQVTESGCRHKVELKLSSSKRMSEVAKHMEAKWSKVRGSVADNLVLHFFQKGHDFANGLAGSWTGTDVGVTCLDIWKQCGRQVSGENVVEVSYGWMLPSPSAVSVAQRKTSLKKTSKLARSSSDLFGPEPLSSLDEKAGAFDASPLSAASTPNFAHEVLLQDDLLSPGRGLQAFGEHLSFERDPSDHKASLGGDLSDAYSDPSSPLSGRPRRRIMPELVPHEEFDI